MKLYLITTVAAILVVIPGISAAILDRANQSLRAQEEAELLDYLRGQYENETSEVLNMQIVAEYDVATDVNNQTKVKAQADQILITADYTKKVWETHFKNLNADDYKDPTLKREITFLKVLGSAVLPDADLQKLNELDTNLTNIYSTAKICPYKDQNCDKSTGLSLDPDIEQIISTSTDYDELEYVWKAWRDASGAKMRKMYKEYVDISNKVAALNGFTDLGEMWRKDYESDTFIKDMDDLWEEVKPLYEDLHAYVLSKLAKRYPDQINKNDTYIPAHVLGNMWAQSWTNIFDLVKPYPNSFSVNITQALLDNQYTVLKMFETSEEFYQSLGLEPSSICFNTSAGAMIEKPADREVLCHASAWDFQNGKDYRIKMCTKINGEDFITIHHEMGHIQYFILYKNQSVTFRAGANPGFHEAIGDTIALSVSTPGHLKKIGLVKNYEETPEAALNELMYQALERVAFLPFGLLIDKWRWDVFSGKAKESEWNQKWWFYRENIQKIKAPVSRTENDFDPGAKYHVPGNSQYIAYFVAHILQFQLHRALCITAGQYDPNNAASQPLHKCDIYQSLEAGKKLRAGLSLGMSRHWSEALKIMTGEEKLSGSALLEYFKPLQEYLQQQNKVASTPQARTKEDSSKSNSSSDVADDQYIPIIVGGVLGALVLVSIVAYLILRRRRNL